jgi:hypothetical protein
MESKMIQDGAPSRRRQKGDQVASIMSANFLDYEPISNISVVDKRSLVRHEFDQQQYGPGETMQIRLGAGDAFTYGPNCYIALDLVVTTGAAQTAGFGQGSALNLFNTTELKSMAGQEIDRLEEIGLYHAKKQRYTKDPQYFSSGAGALLRYESGDNAFANGSTTRIIVPCRDLLGIYGYPGLLPGQGLLAGGVLRLTLAAQDVPLLFSGDDAANTWQIRNPVLVCDELVLSDAFAKRIQIMSARKGPGLSLMWESHYHSATSTNATSVELQMANAVSRATEAFACVRTTANITAIDADSFASKGDTTTAYQFKLGSLRFPDQRVTWAGTRADEAFANSLIAFNSYEKPCGVSVAEFVAAVGRQVFATSFERHHVLQLSGIGVNGSRLLRVNLTKAGNDETVDLFMSYVRFCSVHLDSQTVST